MRCFFLRRAALLGLAGLLAMGATSASAALTLSGGGLTLVEQGGTFGAANLAGASAGSIPFTSSDLGPVITPDFPYHRAVNVNDELYGNSFSWIGNDPAPFAGVALDAPSTIASFAFGRANVGGNTDRTNGLYTLQYTLAPDPIAPAASWTTIGTLNYVPPGGGNFSLPSLRHRFNFDPIVDATGVRLLTPAGAAVDELELYATAGAFVPPPPLVMLTPSAGFGIGFNGNNGVNFTTASPAVVPDNLALASNGAIPLGSSELGAQPEYGIPFPQHRIVTINDGLYGNRNSWIGGDGDTAPFIGVAFDGPVLMDRIAFGRDNGNTVADDCGGTCSDRDTGVYGLQYTQVASPDGTTPLTGDPTTGWASIGTVNILGDDPGVFDAYLRHEFSVSAGGSPILATGMRIIPPGSGIGPIGTAIDELEVYGQAAVPEPSTFVLAGLGAIGLLAARRRRK